MEVSSQSAIKTFKFQSKIKQIQAVLLSSSRYLIPWYFVQQTDISVLNSATVSRWLYTESTHYFPLSVLTVPEYSVEHIVISKYLVVFLIHRSIKMDRHWVSKPFWEQILSAAIHWNSKECSRQIQAGKKNSAAAAWVTGTATTKGP